VTQSALKLARPFDAPSITALHENNLATAVLRQGDVIQSRVLLLRVTRTGDRMGLFFIALLGLRGLAETEISAGGWRNGLVLFAACDAIAAAANASLFRTLDPEERDAIEAAEQHLGLDAAAEARATGERMTLREAVDFAYKINGVTRQ
jgi:hypothetical protein